MQNLLETRVTKAARFARITCFKISLCAMRLFLQGKGASHIYA